MTTTISPLKVAGKMIFLFHRWDMLVSRSVMFLNYLQQLVLSYCHVYNPSIMCIIQQFWFWYHPPKFNSKSPEKWWDRKQILSYWVLVTVQGRTLKLPGGYLPQQMTTSFFLGLTSDWWKSSTRAGMCHTEIPSWHSFYRRAFLLLVDPRYGY